MNPFFNLCYFSFKSFLISVERSNLSFFISSCVLIHCINQFLNFFFAGQFGNVVESLFAEEPADCVGRKAGKVVDFGYPVNLWYVLGIGQRNYLSVEVF